MTLLMRAPTTSLVARLIVRSTSVTTRPTDAAPVTMIPVPAKLAQLSAQLVCPVTTRSISRSRRVITSVIAAPVGLLHWLTRRLVERTGGAALVEQDDDRLDPLPLEQRHEGVHRIGFVVEVDVGRGRRRHDVGRALQRHADDGDLDARELVDGERREDRLAGVLVGHVGGEELEVGALEPVTARSTPRPGGSRPPACASARPRPRRTRGCRRRCNRGRSGSSPRSSARRGRSPRRAAWRR